MSPPLPPDIISSTQGFAAGAATAAAADAIFGLTEIGRRGSPGGHSRLFAQHELVCFVLVACNWSGPSSVIGKMFVTQMVDG